MLQKLSQGRMLLKLSHMLQKLSEMLQRLSQSLKTTVCSTKWFQPRVSTLLWIRLLATYLTRGSCTSVTLFETGTCRNGRPGTPCRTLHRKMVGLTTSIGVFQNRVERCRWRTLQCKSIVHSLHRCKYYPEHQVQTNQLVTTS